MEINFGVMSIIMFLLLWNNFITVILVIGATYVFVSIENIQKKMC